jgi:hypothetical protein
MAMVAAMNSDHANPMPASPASATGSLGATAVRIVAATMATQAPRSVPSPGWERAEAMAPISPPAVAAVNAAPTKDTPPANDVRAKIGTET